MGNTESKSNKPRRGHRHHRVKPIGARMLGELKANGLQSDGESEASSSDNISEASMPDEMTITGGGGGNSSPPQAPSPVPPPSPPPAPSPSPVSSQPDEEEWQIEPMSDIEYEMVNDGKEAIASPLKPMSTEAKQFAGRHVRIELDGTVTVDEKVHSTLVPEQKQMIAAQNKFILSAKATGNEGAAATTQREIVAFISNRFEVDATPTLTTSNRGSRGNRKQRQKRARRGRRAALAGTGGGGGGSEA